MLSAVYALLAIATTSVLALCYIFPPRIPYSLLTKMVVVVIITSLLSIATKLQGW